MPTMPRRHFLTLTSGAVAGGYLAGQQASAVTPQPLAAPPVTIPALQSWTASSEQYTLQTTSRILLSAAHADRLRTTADVLADDIRQITGRSLPVVVQDQPQPAAGDIHLVLATVTGLGEEGYELRVGSTMEVRGAASGVFWGTRTIVQWFRQTTTVPGGVARDWPRYPERGFLVAHVPKYFTMTWYQGQIQELSYLKMNMFWIYVGYDSTPLADMKAIAQYAARYNVTVVPQTNMPDHMARLLHDRPDLQLPGRPQSLDLSKPAAYDFARNLIRPLMPEFNTPYWHIGSDEYLLGTSYSQYPQLHAYAKQRFGPNAKPHDVHYGFINDLNQTVRAAGKTMRIWNDGIYADATVRVDPSVVIEHWTHWDGRKTPQQLVNEGHRIHNATQDFLYYDPGSRYPDPVALYERFRVNVFHGGYTVPENSPQLVGAKLHLWTIPDQETEEFQSDTLMAPFRSLAQLLWGSPRPATYAAFSPAISTVGRAPRFPLLRHRFSPITGTTSLWPHRLVQVRFHDPVDGASVQIAVSTAQGAVPGQTTFDAATRTATFAPAAPWRWDSRHTVSLTARDTAGRQMTDTSWFHSAKPPSTAYPRSIWPDTEGPAVEWYSQGSSMEFGVKFRVDVGGVVLGIRFYKGPGNVGRHIGTLWTAGGTRLASATFTNESAAGWQEVRFATPVRLQPNTTYVASYNSPNGVYGYNHNAFANSGVDNGVLHALSNAAAGGNGVFGHGISVFPNQTYLSTNYWVDVLFNPDTQSIWDRIDRPAFTAQEASSLELGVKFQAGVAGSVLGIRFYKAAGNTGSHVGSLWTAGGSRLASATFTGETASGWQEVRFATPVRIQPNTTFVASYNTPTGAYGATNYGLTSAKHNGVLRAVASAESGGNGVFRIGQGGFPTQSFAATNYFADVVFAVG